MGKVVVILSGGMDSTVVLYDAVNRLGRENVEAISFNYGSKHNDKEIPLAKWHCNKLRISHKVFNLESIFKHFNSNLLKGGDEIPEGMYDQENMSTTVVPNRNMIMLSLGGGYADSIGASKILLGSHVGDHAVYKDCRVEFTKSASLTLYLATDNCVEIESPFNKLTKSNIGEIGLGLGVDFSKTWSCYRGGETHCYRCGTCCERTEVFLENNTKDPAATDEQWEQAVEFYWEFKNNS